MTFDVKRADPKIVEKYWKWLCKIPRAQNPTLNNDGDKDVVANTNRNDEYFFLSFVLGGASRRICKVPQGKKILIPSLSFLASEAERPKSSDGDLDNFANTDYDNIEYRSIEVDGTPIVGNMDRFRVRTGPFEVDYDQNPIFNARPGKSNAVADGNYLVWEPSEKGQHIIHFDGRIDLPEEGNSLESRDYVEDVTYTLVVE